MLYTKYRPKELSEVVGQPSAVATLSDFIAKRNVPRAVLFTGGFGVGKTTLARILARKIGCSDIDIEEVPCAIREALEKVRDIERSMNLSPMGGGEKRVWIFDEVQALSRATFAQQGMLSILEDDHIAPHAHFFLCSSDPSKVAAAVRSRCTTIPLSPVGTADLMALLIRVSKREKFNASQQVVQRIATGAGGSPRKALVTLEKVMTAPDEESRLELAGQDSDESDKGVHLARALFTKNVRWPDVAKALKQAKDEPPDSLRRSILGYAQGILLGNNPFPRAFDAIQLFRDDVTFGGFPAVVANCWEFVHQK